MPLRVEQGKPIILQAAAFVSDDTLGQATIVNKISWIKQEQTQWCWAASMQMVFQQNDDITQRYVSGDVLSEQNIILSYVRDPKKSEHVYAGLQGAKVLSIPQSTAEKLLKPLWSEEMKVKLKCFQASQLSSW